MAAGEEAVYTLTVTVIEAQNLPVSDDMPTIDPFVVVEAGGVSSQTEVVQGQVNPIWDHACTLTTRFGADVREELRVMCWHEAENEDVVVAELEPRRSSEPTKSRRSVATRVGKHLQPETSVALRSAAHNPSSPLLTTLQTRCSQPFDPAPGRSSSGLGRSLLRRFSTRARHSKVGLSCWTRAGCWPPALRCSCGWRLGMGRCERGVTSNVIGDLFDVIIDVRLW